MAIRRASGVSITLGLDGVAQRKVAVYTANTQQRLKTWATIGRSLDSFTTTALLVRICAIFRNILETRSEHLLSF